MATKKTKGSSKTSTPVQTSDWASEGPGGGPGVDKIGMMQQALRKTLPTQDYLVDLDPSRLKESFPHISTGILSLDMAIGGGLNEYGVQACPGYPKGRITQIWGANHSGKTTVCLQAAKSVIRNGGQVVYIDYEGAIDPIYSSRIVGVPFGSSKWLNWTKPKTLEAGMQLMYGAALAGIDLIIVDSIGAAITAAKDAMSLDSIGGDQKDGGGLGHAARLWSSFLPKFQKALTDGGDRSVVLAISQSRSKIGGMSFGPQTSPQGGKAWEYWSAIRMELSRVASHKRKEYVALKNAYVERVFAATIKVKLHKVKVAASTNHEGEFLLVSGEGADNLWTMVEAAKSHGLVKGTGWLTWTRPNGEVFKHQGVLKFKAALLEDPLLLAEFEAQVRLLFLRHQEAIEGDGGDEAGGDALDNIRAEILSMRGEAEDEDEE